MRDPSEPYRDWVGGATITALSMAVAGATGLMAAQHLKIFADPPSTHLYYLAKAAARLPDGMQYLHWLADRPGQAFIYYAIPAISASAAGWLAWSWFGRVINPVGHVSGGRLLRGKEAAAEAKAVTQSEVRASGYGIKFHKYLQFAKHQELTSYLFLAGQRGGKTNILFRLLEKVWARGDKVISFDFKTDFTESTPPTQGGKHPIIFAPWDNRSAVWDIGKDVREVQHARAFIAGIIPANDKDPMWSNAARALGVAVVMKQIAEHGTDWGWQEYGVDAFLPIIELKKIAEKYYPPALAIVEDAESKTAGSVMINLHAFLSPVDDLRRMWGNRDKKRRVSFDTWLRNDNTAFRNIVIQGSTEFASLSQALIKSIIETCVSILASPAFPQSRSRRIWWVMDEFVQFGKLDSINVIPEVLASRGCSLIVAIQSIDQVEKLYSREIKAIFGNIFQTKIFGRITGATDAEWVQHQASKRKISKPTRTTSGIGGGQVNISQSYVGEETEVIRKEDLGRLGMVSYGQKGKQSKPEDLAIRAIVLGHGINALELEWPLFIPKQWRPGHVPWQALTKAVSPNPISPGLRPQAAPAVRPEVIQEQHQHQIAKTDSERKIEIAQPDLIEAPSESDNPWAQQDQMLMDGLLNILESKAEPTVAGEVVNEILSEALDANALVIEAVEALVELATGPTDDQVLVEQKLPVGVNKRRKRKPRSYEDS